MIEIQSQSESERPVATAMKVNSDTMEDRLAVSIPPVRDDNLDACFTVLQNGSELELLTVTPDNRLLHVFRTNQLDTEQNQPSTRNTEQTAGKSDSGWSEKQVSVPDSRTETNKWVRDDIAEIRGFRQNGVSYALIHYPEKVGTGHNEPKRRYIEPMVQDAQGEWGSWKVKGEVANALWGSEQTELFVTPQGDTLIYGKPTGYSSETEVFALVFQDNGTWKTGLASFPLEAEHFFRLASNTDPQSLGTLFRLGRGALIEYQHIGIKSKAEDGVRLDYSQSWKQIDLDQYIKGIGDLSAARFLDIPDQPGNFVVHSSTTKKVYLVSNIESGTPVVKSLSDDGTVPLTVDIVRVARDDTSSLKGTGNGEVRAAVFAIDATSRRCLWIKRQAGTDTNGVPLFSDWSRLSEQTRTVAVPYRMKNGAEMFVVTEQTHCTGFLSSSQQGIAIERKAQDPSGQAWHSTTIETARESIDQPESCITHTTEITLTTQEGRLASDALVYMTSSFPCTAVVNGVSRHLSCTEPIRAFANESGMIIVKFKADSVDAPVFKVAFPSGDAEPREFGSNGAVARRLAGRQKDHKIDEDRLHTAGLLPDSLHGTQQGKDLAEIVRKAGESLGQNTQGTTPGITKESASYHITVKNADAPNAVPVLSIRKWRGPLPDDLSIGGATHLATTYMSANGTDGLFSFIGDVINWIRTSVTKVAEWAITIGKACIQFVFKLGEQAYNFIVDTAAGITQGMETLFQTISDAVKVVIDAAKTLLNVVASLFDTKAILRTNDCLSYVINGGLLLLEKTVGDGLSTLVHDVTGKVIQNVDSQLSNIETFAKQMTLSQIFSSGIPNKKEGTSTYSGINSVMQTGGVQARWVSERITTHSDRFDKLCSANLITPQDGGRLTEKLKALADELMNYDEHKDSLSKVVIDLAKDIGETLKEGLTAADLYKIIGYVRRVIHLSADLVVKVLDVIFALLAEAIALFRKFLNQQIDIPGVTQLAWLILGRKLTVMDLFTFMYSVALTVFWKIVTLGKEPFDEATKDSLLNSGLLPTKGGQSQNSIDPIDLTALLSVELASLFKETPSPENVERVKKSLNQYKGIVRALTPVVTVCNLIGSFVSATICAPLAAATDALDSAIFGAGSKTFGVINAVIGAVNSAVSVIGTILSLVRNLVMEYLPESAEGVLWKKEQQLKPAGNWPSMTWLIGLAAGIVGFVCGFIPAPIGGYASAAIDSIIGVVGIAGCVIYTGIMIANNTGLRGWEIANEFGMLVGQIPLMFRWVPAVNDKLIKIVPVGTIASGILICGLALADISCGLVSAVTAIGNTIDENVTNGWADFS
ncbi:MAG: hypothetical protein H6R19_1983 [Proteobacteria bacterium]|nr:hypothetical protein [Pseudomonadota bacterium]